MPRYSSGADETARHAPARERREVPTSNSSAPVPSASQLSASATVGDGSDRTSASIGAVEKAFCVPRIFLTSQLLDPRARSLKIASRPFRLLPRTEPL